MEVLMSSFTLTLVIPTTENERTFLMHVIQAALKAYRQHRNTGGQVNGNGLSHATHDAVRTLRTVDLPVLQAGGDHLLQSNAQLSENERKV
jgi:hypothetical protein